MPVCMPGVLPHVQRYAATFGPVGRSCRGTARGGGGDGRVTGGRLGGRAGTLARAVPGAAAAQGAAALGALLPQGPAAAGRTEERRADGRARGAGRPPAVAPLRLHLALGDGAPGGRAGEGRRPAGGRAGRRRCWSWTTPRSPSRGATRSGSSASTAASSASGRTASRWSRSPW